MSNEAPGVKREGTMQKTAREAKEYGYGCDCGDEEHNHGEAEEHGEEGETNGDSNPPTSKRQSTMQLTAQEGVDYLKSQRKDTLLEAQGLIEPRKKKNEGNDDDDDDEKSDEVPDDEEGEEVPTDEDVEEVEKNGKAPSPKKTRTMAATAAEGEMLLEYMGGKPDAEARTRGQQKELDEDAEDDLSDEPEAKKPRRTITMQATADEAKVLVDEAEVGGTRSETAQIKQAEQEKISPKRASTMQKTAQEGAEFVQGHK